MTFFWSQYHWWRSHQPHTTSSLAASSLSAALRTIASEPDTVSNWPGWAPSSFFDTSNSESFWGQMRRLYSWWQCLLFSGWSSILTMNLWFTSFDPCMHPLYPLLMTAYLHTSLPSVTSAPGTRNSSVLWSPGLTPGAIWYSTWMQHLSSSYD